MRISRWRFEVLREQSGKNKHESQVVPSAIVITAEVC